MCRMLLTLLLIASLSRPGSSQPPDELSDMLARAEALYYQADFAKSVELLLRADELLRPQSGHVAEKTDVKLQLALGYIGLNDSARAKAYLVKLYALDADHRIDPQLFSPKVIQLADDAKVEQERLRCRALSDEAQRQLGSGNGDAAVQLIQSSQTKCSDLTELSPRAADLVFKEGLDAYKKAQIPEALQKFRAVLAVEPKHELAAQYMDLTQSKLEVRAERAFLAWQKDFQAHEFALAARDYREVTAVSNSQTIDQVRLEYRHALSGLVDSWNRACAKNDVATIENLRVQVNEMLPEPSLGEDILSKMKTCAPPAGCIPMESHLALTRLQYRVDPVFPAYVKSQIKTSPVRILVRTQINEKESIASSEMQGGSPLLYEGVRSALNRWRFSPTVTEEGARCVDTEIPFVITFDNQDFD